MTVPADIGIPQSANCLYWVHTHDNSGIIHIESPVKRTIHARRVLRHLGPRLELDEGSEHWRAARRGISRFWVNGNAWHGSDPRAIVSARSRNDRHSERAAVCEAGATRLVEILSRIELDGHHLTLEAIEAVADGAPRAHRSGSAASGSGARATLLIAFRKRRSDLRRDDRASAGWRRIRVDPGGRRCAASQPGAQPCRGNRRPARRSSVRAASVLRANSLCAGHSGVKPETLDLIVAMLERGVTPVVPSQGSVGASGDLAPLAHMTLTLIGEGEAFYRRASAFRAAVALERAGLQPPIELGAKEGLALVNGTQVMTGIAALGVLRAERLAAAADVDRAHLAGGLSGHRTRLRSAPQRSASASRTGARCREPARAARRLGDRAVARRVRARPRSVFVPLHSGRPRCRTRLDLAHVRRVTEIEANSVTDNPLVFPEDGEFISGGNFHGEPIALVIDFLKIAVAELASIAERRLYLLLNARGSRPAALSRKPR